MRPASASTAGRSVCVAIPTFRRPLQLAELLSKIDAQVLDGIAMSLVVIDNDPDCSARPILTAFAGQARFPVSYESMPHAGLSDLRNRAIDAAEESGGLLVMIDDDELPSSDWLRELVAVQSETDADAVIGPVPPEFPRDAPQWLIDGRFFDLARAPDRSLVDDGYTGNCLIRIDSVRAMGLAFDPRMDRSGGEDQLFFRQMYARGGRIAYAARAVAVEPVAPHRLTMRWLLQRYMRRGHTIAICDRQIHGTARVLAVRTAKALGLIGTGAALLILRALRNGMGGAMRSACDVARGVGMAMALAGIGMSYRDLGAKRGAVATSQAARPPEAAR
jgi:succinoglycan biosynthesis protein ExoM